MTKVAQRIMALVAAHWALFAVGCATHTDGGGGPALPKASKQTVTVTVTVERKVIGRFTMPQKSATALGRCVAKAPKGDAQARCNYWQMVPRHRCSNNDNMLAVRLYKNEWCRLAAEHARKTRPVGSVRKCGPNPNHYATNAYVCRYVCRGGEELDKARNKCVPDTSTRAAATARRKRIETELRTGRCAKLHFNGYQRILGALRRLFRTLGRRTHFSVAANRVVVATKLGVTATFRTLVGGEHHIVVLGVSGIAVEVKGPQGYNVSNTSILGRLTRQQLGVDLRQVKSRVVQMTAGKSISVKVTGRGCAMILDFRKF